MTSVPGQNWRTCFLYFQRCWLLCQRLLWSLYFFAVGLYVKDSWDLECNAVGLYVKDSCDFYWCGMGLSQEPLSNMFCHWLQGFSSLGITPMIQFLSSVCVCDIWTDVKLLNFEWLYVCRGTWHTIRDHVQRSYLIVWDTEPDQLCVPAARIFRNSKGPSLEPQPQYYTICCTVVAIWNYVWSFMLGSIASEPSSVFSPKPCRRHYFWFSGLFRRNHVADVFGLFCQNHVADI